MVVMEIERRSVYGLVEGPGVRLVLPRRHVLKDLLTKLQLYREWLFLALRRDHGIRGIKLSHLIG